MQADILNLAGRTITGALTWEALTTKVLKGIEDGDAHDHINTGYRELDGYYDGLGRGELTIIAARPSMGKSALATNILLHCAQAGLRAVVFSTEVTPEQINKNMLIIQSQVPSGLLKGKIQDGDWSKVAGAAAHIHNLDIVIDNEQPVTIGRVISAVEVAHQVKPVDLVIVDYIQDMAAPAADRRDLELAKIVQPLKALAMRLRCAVIAVSQLSRKTEDRTDKRPHLADLRESGSIEQAADKVILLFRAGYYDVDLDPGPTELIVAKNRNGATGMMQMKFIPKTITFRDAGDMR